MPCWSYSLLYRCLLTLIRWRIGQVQGDNPIALGMTFIRSLDFSLQLSEELATEDSSKWTSVPSISVFRKGFILSQQKKQQLLNNVRDGAKTALDRYQKFALKTRNLLEYVLLFVPSEAKKMKASTCQSLCKISWSLSSGATDYFYDWKRADDESASRLYEPIELYREFLENEAIQRKYGVACSDYSSCYRVLRGGVWQPVSTLLSFDFGQMRAKWMHLDLDCLL